MRAPVKHIHTPPMTLRPTDMNTAQATLNEKKSLHSVLLIGALITPITFHLCSIGGLWYSNKDFCEPAAFLPLLPQLKLIEESIRTFFPLHQLAEILC